MALDHFELVRSNKRLNEKVVEQNTVLKAANAQLDELLKEKMKALEVAREIQQKLLPQEIPQLQGWEVAAKTVYCEETGGDYFDFIFRAGRTDQLGIVVGDVTGHGIGAALLMASVRAFIRGLFYQPFNLSEQITQVNKLLAEDTYQTGRFMTLCFLEIEAESNLIKWVRAGHDPAILYNPVTNEFSELKGEGLIMGVDKSYEYEQFQVKIPEPGTVILIGTDGIWEAKNKAGVMFGKERVKDVIRSSSDKSSAEIIDALIRELQNFRKREDFEDDVTLVLIRSNHGMKGRA